MLSLSNFICDVIITVDASMKHQLFQKDICRIFSFLNTVDFMEIK